MGLKIGLVGGASVYHGMAFAEMFNGYDKEKSLNLKWPAQHNARVADHARITHIWDENREHAREVADVCGIAHVVSEMEEMIGNVDGVMIIDDCTMTHQRRALPFLEKGIPTFIDKPLSSDVAEAERIVALARAHRAPLMSTSALCYAREVPEALKEANIGEIITGVSVCREWMGNFTHYGIHAVALLYAIVGPGVESVRSVGKQAEDLVVVTFKSGKRFMVVSYEAITPVFQIHLYGSQGDVTIRVNDFDFAYSEMLRHFVNMVETGDEPEPLEHAIEIIKTLALAERSRESGKMLLLS